MNFLDKLDPELRQWIEAQPQYNLETLPLSYIAELARKRPILFPLEQAEGIDINDHTLPTSGVKIRVYKPKGRTEKLPLYVYYYGGGFFSGSIAHNDMLCQRWAMEAQCAVATVEYRKVPEHPYPAAFDDCYDTLLWAAENGAFNSQKIVVGGVSAGGSLAAGVALKARDTNGPTLQGQLLIIPGLDHRFVTPSSYLPVDTRIWNRSLALKAWEAWLKNCTKDIPVYASPATCTDFSDLPPAFVSAESEDILFDEAQIYAKNLIEAGVKTKLHIAKRAFHASFAYLPDAEPSRNHHQAIIQALKNFIQ
ncbi:alpha/beta hydrolase fold domain-containing protein [Temperatibacter marinus]|uniref:Alpha/beta hydrolase fold domain-containing protein n=1 Tax=Temperatibacter marinus TaxID=1456591 RepID=A0AA52ECQ6_9PROT|nr:alpha/beta hydrolase fold domain-containing protein [Temperatibacter marinus]WND03017.1 alpha/beta hydrolase fold domain-containing protein [Temperatibacter marinus]